MKRQTFVLVTVQKRSNLTEILIKYFGSFFGSYPKVVKGDCKV